jgi:hypothetical protein
VTIVDVLNRIVGCVTHQRLSAFPLPGGGDADAWIAFRSVAPLRCGEPLRGASLVVRVFVRSLDGRRWQFAPRVVGYDYALLDRDGVELLAYHWHPGRGSLGADVPHAHLSAALRPNRSSGATAILPLDKRHLLTGPIPLADFLRMLVTEFAVAPLVADWPSRLAPDG